MKDEEGWGRCKRALIRGELRSTRSAREKVLLIATKTTGCMLEVSVGTEGHRKQQCEWVHSVPPRRAPVTGIY